MKILNCTKIYLGLFLILTNFFNILSKEQETSTQNTDVIIQKEKKPKFKIGLCIVATGRYIDFAYKLIESAEKYFCKNHKVTYFVFTDAPIPACDNIVRIYQERFGWPLDTMFRPVLYDKHRALLASMDYLFASDADMLFVDYVGDEILSPLVATRHPGFMNQRGSYECKNPKSKAYVSSNEGKYYFAGGFYGGESKEFLKMASKVSSNVLEDLSKNFIAEWHEESHNNRYFIDNEPTLILNPSYCYPEHWTMPYSKKLLALDKNHKEMRK